MRIDNYKKELSEIKDAVFIILAIWTVVLIVFCWLIFFYHQFDMPQSMVFSYLLLLGAYIAGKEANRWGGIKMRHRPGQFFVYIWWLNLLVMFIVSFFMDLEMVSQIKNISYEVTGGLIISEISKIFQARHITAK